jgi:hypothetical protein
MNTTIILTSTVNINPVKCHLFQRDTSERLTTYLKSILQWLHKTKFNIVLVENSGYSFDELLDNEKNLFHDRFEFISFKEDELEEANYLKDNNSKGASELFSINYAYHHSRLIQQSQFVIKVTARFFIPELESYLLNYDLNQYDCLTQTDRERCEMVGCHIRHFFSIFKTDLINENNEYLGHVEYAYKDRTSCYPSVLVCKPFMIEETQRGGSSGRYNYI